MKKITIGNDQKDRKWSEISLHVPETIEELEEIGVDPVQLLKYAMKKSNLGVTMRQVVKSQEKAQSEFEAWLKTCGETTVNSSKDEIIEKIVEFSPEQDEKILRGHKPAKLKKILIDAIMAG